MPTPRRSPRQTEQKQNGKDYYNLDTTERDTGPKSIPGTSTLRSRRNSAAKARTSTPKPRLPKNKTPQPVTPVPVSSPQSDDNAPQPLTPVAVFSPINVRRALPLPTEDTVEPSPPQTLLPSRRINSHREHPLLHVGIAFTLQQILEILALKQLVKTSDAEPVNDETVSLILFHRDNMSFPPLIAPTLQYLQENRNEGDIAALALWGTLRMRNLEWMRHGQGMYWGWMGYMREIWMG